MQDNFVLFWGHYFKLDTLQTAVQLIHPGCFMSTLDLKDAYYSIPIAEEHQKYLKFYWKDMLYTFTCLPMGLCSSPRIFTKVMKPIFATLRRRFGHVCLNYIDDSLYIGNSASDCAETILHAIELFGKLGFRVHPDKSVIVPSQTIEFLGFVINSITMTVSLSDRKRNKLHALYLSFSQAGKRFTIREVVSFTGKLVSSFLGVEFGPLHYRSLVADKERHLKLFSGNFDAQFSLSHSSISELGWGAKHSLGSQTAGIWSKSESTLHFNQYS